MKQRRHHNNTARRSTKRGKRKQEVERMAKRLNIPVRRPRRDYFHDQPEENPDSYGWGI